MECLIVSQEWVTKRRLPRFPSDYALVFRELRYFNKGKYDGPIIPHAAFRTVLDALCRHMSIETVIPERVSLVLQLVCEKVLVDSLRGAELSSKEQNDEKYQSGAL